jgi:hypothetical protein
MHGHDSKKMTTFVEAIWASKVAYAKPFKVVWGIQDWTLESNKCN